MFPWHPFWLMVFGRSRHHLVGLVTCRTPASVPVVRTKFKVEYGSQITVVNVTVTIWQLRLVRATQYHETH